MFCCVVDLGRFWIRLVLIGWVGLMFFCMGFICYDYNDCGWFCIFVEFFFLLILGFFVLSGWWRGKIRDEEFLFIFKLESDYYNIILIILLACVI